MASYNSIPPFARLDRPVSIEEIKTFCQRHHIQRMEVFGSILTPQFNDESDVNILVAFDPDHIPGFAFAGMQDELTLLLGRQVNLVTRGFLRERIYHRVRASAFLLYEAPPQTSAEDE